MNILENLSFHPADRPFCEFVEGFVRGNYEADLADLVKCVQEIWKSKSMMPTKKIIVEIRREIQIEILEAKIEALVEGRNVNECVPLWPCRYRVERNFPHVYESNQAAKKIGPDSGSQTLWMIDGGEDE